MPLSLSLSFDLYDAFFDMMDVDDSILQILLVICSVSKENVTQLVRVSVCQIGGREFESRLSQCTLFF